MKDVLADKNGLNVSLKHGRMQEPSRIFCDRIEYMHVHGKFKGKPTFDHHLMFYYKDRLIFKAWLPNGKNAKEHKGVEEALKYAGFNLIKWK